MHWRCGARLPEEFHSRTFRLAKANGAAINRCFLLRTACRYSQSLHPLHVQALLYKHCITRYRRFFGAVNSQTSGGARILRRLIMLCVTWIGLAAVALPQEGSSISGPDAIAARQASLDMSSITFRAMGDAMKAGREAKSQGYPA